MQAGEDEGFRRLLEDHGGRITAGLLSEFGANIGTARIDEAIADALGRAWHHAAFYDVDRGTLRAWFYVVARNCLRRILGRERSRRDHLELDAIREAFAEQSDDVTEPHRWASLVTEAVANLPPMQRAVIEADLAEGGLADGVALAARLGTTTNSIYSTRSQAIKRLRGILASRLERDES